MCFQCLKRLPKERSSLQNSPGPAAKNNLDSLLPRGEPTPAIAAHPLTKPPVAFRASRLSAARKVLTLALWGDYRVWKWRILRIVVICRKAILPLRERAASVDWAPTSFTPRTELLRTRRRTNSAL